MLTAAIIVGCAAFVGVVAFVSDAIDYLDESEAVHDTDRLDL